MKVYDENEIKEKLNDIQGWEYRQNQLSREFELKDFISVIKFVTRVADEAEKMNHHPDILIHSWNKIKFSLSTHSEGGITKNDFELAEKINQLFIRDLP
jgi:4a-hydroxytetrahydrobiopterin dehydratase